MRASPTALALAWLLLLLPSPSRSFSPASTRTVATTARPASAAAARPALVAFLPPSRTSAQPPRPSTSLGMSDAGGGGGTARAKSKKKGLSTIVKERTELEQKEDKKKEEQWRVVLHNDEVHTFNYVIASLCKCIGTVDRKRAFDICVVTHGTGKATITKTWKKQAEQYCLGLQRQGLTVSIAPDSKFEGGGDGDGGEGGGGGHSGGGF